MFKRIKDESPTIQMFFLFGLIVFGFLIYMTLQSVIVMNTIPGVAEMNEEEIMIHVMGSDTGVSQLLLILQQVLFFLIPGIMINYILKSDGKGIYQMNHSWKGFLSPIMLMLVAIFSLYFLININLNLIELLPNSAYLIEMDAERSSVITLSTNHESPFIFMLNFIGIAMLPAVGEELIFRGFLIRNFYQNSNNIYFAVFGSSALFALIHFQPLKFIPMFLIGLLLALFYVQTKNILVPIACHFINNAVSLISLKYNIMEYTENMMISGLAAAYLLFRVGIYVRNLGKEKVSL
jgi:membrane protease YdiL (CAAX protease family)